jgi:hypothetical protein
MRSCPAGIAPLRHAVTGGHHGANEIAARLSVLSEMVDTAESILQDYRHGFERVNDRESVGIVGIRSIVGECARGSTHCWMFSGSVTGIASGAT